MVVQSGLSRGQGFAGFAHQSPRSGTMISSTRSAGGGVGVPHMPRRPKRRVERHDGTEVQSARNSEDCRRWKSDLEPQMPQDAREAILELRTTLQTLKAQEQRSWRQKSQLMRNRRFESNPRKKHWATSDLSDALGEEALALGAAVAQQRDAMQAAGNMLRRDLRVQRKPPLPTFRRQPGGSNILADSSNGTSGSFDHSMTDRPLPPPVHVEVDPRTAAILARVEPDNHAFALSKLGTAPKQAPEPMQEPGPDPSYEKGRARVWEIILGKQTTQADPFEQELQQHFDTTKTVSAPRPPEISRVEYFRQLDAKARREKLLRTQREEAERKAAVVAARQAMTNSELERRTILADEAAATVISAAVEDLVRVAAEVEQAPSAPVAQQTLEVAAREAQFDAESQAAATRAAESVAAGRGDASLQRRVAQRWLFREIMRCSQMYR